MRRPCGRRDCLRARANRRSAKVDTSGLERREVHYSGRVQGVGFRYTVHGASRQYEVTGFVRNLPDGRVQLIAEGVAAELDRFLDEIAEQMSGYITKQHVQPSNATGEFADFGIRF